MNDSELFLKKKPKVSIITPCYNAEKFIASTIESVINQTYTNWEMLICDDCSNDKSVEIVNSYCNKDSRIKLLRTVSNTGTPAVPRNLAIQHSKGDYVAFLDSDDIWFPQKLESQMEFMAKHGYDFVYSNYEKMNVDGIRANRNVCVAISATYKSMLKSCDVPFLTALLKRDLISDIKFKSTSKEDYVFWLEVFRRTNIVAYNTNSVLAIYREANDSRSGNKLRMIKGQWNVLRCYEQINYLSCIYYMIVYLVKGYLKYVK